MADGFPPWLSVDANGHSSVPPPVESWMLERFGPLPADLASQLRTAGLHPAPPGGGRDASALFGQAAGLIARVPELQYAVATVVGHVHALVAPPGYDVSHSEPRWRTTIFVSIPERNDAVGALRLAESVTHEAMHLLLTNWEAEGAFVADAEAVLHSPWRRRERPAQGVLHGTFVFVCIQAFFSRLSVSGLDPAGTEHVGRRLGEIADELSALDLPSLRSVLTSRGQAFLERWIDTGKASRAVGCVRAPSNGTTLGAIMTTRAASDGRRGDDRGPTGS